ncbi:uncharacterized protein LOC125178640 [Hyalella azteca]|uniref:Uncharacterized protein LOC125178640 n=1 Tax=Hyalella azteca TaxID=294128 RepID=A0A979FQB8_HYAAZ|nr:uncharacterized protein LOC125178640 [Hyalella azteca]
MNTVQDLIDEENWQEATTYVVQKGKYTSLLQLRQEEQDEECAEEEDQRVVYGLILSIKKYHDNSRKLPFLRHGKIVAKYDRLVLLRKLKTGEAFYIIAATQEEAFHLFRSPNVPYIGQWVAVYEPRSAGKIHQLTILDTNTSLVPLALSPNTADIRLSTVLGAASSKEPVMTFLIEVPASDVLLGTVGLPPACSAVMCNSLHLNVLGKSSEKSGKSCPALVGGRTDHRTLTCSVTIKGHKISRCPFSSETLANLLISKTVLQSEKIYQDRVREGVKKLFKSFVDSDISIIVGGWFKLTVAPADSDQDAPKLRRNVHISLLTPKALPEDFQPISIDRDNNPGMTIPTTAPQAEIHPSIRQRRMHAYMTPDMTAERAEDVAGPSRLQRPKITPGQILLTSFTTRSRDLDHEEQATANDETEISPTQFPRKKLRILTRAVVHENQPMDSDPEETDTNIENNSE